MRVLGPLLLNHLWQVTYCIAPFCKWTFLSIFQKKGVTKGKIACTRWSPTQIQCIHTEHTYIYTQNKYRRYMYTTNKYKINQKFIYQCFNLFWKLLAIDWFTMFIKTFMSLIRFSSEFKISWTMLWLISSLPREVPSAIHSSAFSRCHSTIIPLILIKPIFSSLV